MTTTREYKLFHKNFDRLCVEVGQALPVVANKAFQKKLISSGNVEKANMIHLTEYERSSALVMLLLKRIEGNTKDFYTILDIFKEISVMEGAVKLLDPQHQAGTASAAASSSPATATSTQDGISQKLLERPSVKQAYVALIPVADRWRQIGTMLDLPSVTLASINNEHHSDKDKLLALVNAWLTQIDNVTWKALIEAVAIENSKVAAEIERKYS